jgi:tetraprenyl-beta-curcumene synthase
MARAGAALALADVRYLRTIAPPVRMQLQRWELRAEAIGDPALRSLALAKLHDESFNAEVAAMVATGVSPTHRTRAVEAIVALEVLFDYLDGLTEVPAGRGLRDGHQLFRALTDAVALDTPVRGGYYRHHGQTEDGYLEELIAAVRGSLASLPAAGQVREALVRCASRCAEAQLRTHAIPRYGPAQAERWAQVAAVGSSLGWREFLAGAASSVLAMHALIAAASDPRTTHEHALAIDALYLPICVMPSILDSIVDHAHDLRSGSPSFLSPYPDAAALALQLDAVAEYVVARARMTPGGTHHAMILAGIVAYYATNPLADSKLGRPVNRRLCRRLQPAIAPALLTLHAWRLLRGLRDRWERRRARSRGPSRSSIHPTSP